MQYRPFFLNLSKNMISLEFIQINFIKHLIYNNNIKLTLKN